jgi:hypothetical protein
MRHKKRFLTMLDRMERRFADDFRHHDAVLVAAHADEIGVDLVRVLRQSVARPAIDAGGGGFGAVAGAPVTPIGIRLIFRRSIVCRAPSSDRRALRRSAADFPVPTS